MHSNHAAYGGATYSDDGNGSHPSRLDLSFNSGLGMEDREALEAHGRRMRNVAIVVMVAVFAMVPLCAVGAYMFMGNTVMMYNPPKGSMVGDTNLLSNTIFRTQVFHNPVFMLVESKVASEPVFEVGDGALCKLTSFVAAFQDPSFTHVIGYCPYAATGAMLVATDFITSDNRSTLLVADFVIPQTITEGEAVQNKLMNEVRGELSRNYGDALSIKFSSVGLVSSDLVAGLVGDLLKIDALSIPIAMLALAVCLRSVRMLIVPGVVLPVVICIAFAISYVVSLGIEVSAFAPEMTSATMVAVTIDYSLFILSRFLELAPRFETEHGGDTPHVRYMVCKATAIKCAHNIGVSGLTIGVALGGLILMPVKFIGSIGYIFFIACVVAVCVSLTLMPSILLVFYSFFRQETDFGAPLRWARETFGGAPRAKESESSQVDGVVAHGKGPVSQTPLIDQSKTLGGVGGGVNYPSTADDGNVPRGGDIEAEIAAYDAVLRKRQYSSWWFKVGRMSFRHPLPVIAAVLAFGSPFIYLTSQIEVNFDLFQQVPSASAHGATLKFILGNIGNGQAAPFFITLDTGKAGSITVNQSSPTADLVFERAVALSKHLDAHVHQGLDRFTSFAMFGGVAFDPLMAWYLRDDARNPDYRVLWNNTVDPTGRAGVIRLTVDFDPFDSAANKFLNNLNDGIESFDTRGAFKVGLMGASSTSWAIMRKVMELFPLQIGITFAIIFVLIAAVFRSVFVPFRMLLTVAYTVAVSLGVGVLVFQYTWVHPLWTAMHNVNSYSWTVPIFAFSLLCALALDYDVFLLTRLVEMHERGYDPEAAMAKAVWRTGRIISFAGVIMAVSFGSMVFSDIVMLNQFGFICAFAVLLDTFVIRSLFVPALMSLNSRVAWWPRRFPEPTLGMDDMQD